jgi:mevalonate kinase
LDIDYWVFNIGNSFLSNINYLLTFSTTYRANGKLLLTGEYLVLHGAKAIALPLKVGQQLMVSDESISDSIYWQAMSNGLVWFSCELNPTDFSIRNSSHQDKAELLSLIFKTIKSMNPEFAPKAGIQFETILESNPEWGFGSSSTLVSLLSQWAGIDSFKLNELVFNGSGFDIACAAADGPIFYIQNKPVEPLLLDYPFADQLFLVYSGRKKKTATEVSTFLKEKRVSAQLIDEVSALTDEFALCRDQTEFNLLIRLHEELVSKVIGRISVKPEYFGDFKGEVKSLGAWGGDFFLVSTNKLTFDEVGKYFENKGLMTVFKWGDLILKRPNP